MKQGFMFGTMLVFVLGAFLILPVCNPKEAKIGGRNHTTRIESETLTETRDIFVNLPADYETSAKRYPVLFVLDGESIFGFAVGAVDFLSIARIPEMIVVGIPNTHRERDQWVSFQPDGGYIRFVEFLKYELIPYIDAHYRTQPFRIFYGFCSGVSTCLWTLFTRPEMFEGYIASGAGFDQAWCDFGKKELGKYTSLKKFLFVTTEGTTFRAEGNRMLNHLLETSAPQGLSWKCTIMEGEEHGPLLAKGLFAGLEFIFKDWRLPIDVAAEGPDAVEKYYVQLSRIYGFECGVPERPVLDAGFGLLYYQGKVKAAVDICRFMTEKYPDSPDAFEILGAAYERNNELELARRSYRVAVQKAKDKFDGRLLAGGAAPLPPPRFIRRLPRGIAVGFRRCSAAITGRPYRRCLRSLCGCFTGQCGCRGGG